MLRIWRGAGALDVGIVGRAFGAAIPGMIVGGAVLVIFAVRLVVFLVVGDEVFEGEAVMGGDEIYAGPGRRPCLLKKSPEPHKPRRESGGGGVAFPVIADRVAEFVVPLGPAGGKFANLIAARAAVPWFGDQFHGAKNGSWLHALRKPLWLSKPLGSRARMVPRSKRKPST